MKRKTRFRKGYVVPSELVEMYHSFERLCDEEGPGAADEGELANLIQEMTEAYLRKDRTGFLDALSRAMQARDGPSYAPRLFADDC